MEGLRAIVKEISFLRFIPSENSVTTVEGLRAFAKEISFLRFVPSGVRLWSTARVCEGNLLFKISSQRRLRNDSGGTARLCEGYSYSLFPFQV